MHVFKAGDTNLNEIKQIKNGSSISLENRAIRIDIELMVVM